MNEDQAFKCMYAFEKHIAEDPVRGIRPDYFLRKLISHDYVNPEYLDRLVDKEWAIWRESWQSCLIYENVKQ